jgi:RimJ/RimL family protein N-acetyltransferase
MLSTPFFAPTSFKVEDLTLRCYAPGDGPALQAATVSSYEHLNPWMPWATTEQTVEEAEALARRFSANYLLNQDYVVAIVIDDELAGGTGFHLRGKPVTGQMAEIGMWVSAKYAGQGVGTRVLDAMLRWGFSEWPWNRLTWHCDTRNHRSRRVAEKNGLILEGTLRQDSLDSSGEWRDTHLFSILRDEWLRR